MEEDEDKEILSEAEGQLSVRANVQSLSYQSDKKEVEG